MLVLFSEAVIGIVCSGITDENLHGDCDFADDNSFSGDDIWTDTNFCVSLVDDKLSTGGGGGDNDGVHVFKDGSLVDDEWPVLVDGSLSDGDGLIFNLGLLFQSWLSSCYQCLWRLELKRFLLAYQWAMQLFGWICF